MNYDLALKVIKSESYEQTAHRIVELYEVIEKLTAKKYSSIDLKDKFKSFIKEQESLPEEFIKTINDNFWDLI